MRRSVLYAVPIRLEGVVMGVGGCDGALRERVEAAVGNAVWVVDLVLAVFAERERVLRERTEALPHYKLAGLENPVMKVSEDGVWVLAVDVLAVFDEEGGGGCG